jgi:hypothetical protein
LLLVPFTSDRVIPLCRGSGHRPGRARPLSSPALGTSTQRYGASGSGSPASSVIFVTTRPRFTTSARSVCHEYGDHYGDLRDPDVELGKPTRLAAAPGPWPSLGSQGALRTRFLAKISEEEGRSTMDGKRGRGRTRDAEKMPTLLWAERQGTWTSTSTNNRGWSPC